MNQNSLFKTLIGCKGLTRFFISSRKKGKESKIAERPRERVRAMQSIAAREW